MTFYSPNQKLYKNICKIKNVRNYDLGKVAKFQDSRLNDFGAILKIQRGVESNPHRRNRINRCFLKCQNTTNTHLPCTSNRTDCCVRNNNGIYSVKFSFPWDEVKCKSKFMTSMLQNIVEFSIHLINGYFI